jgi:hypothetical protein
MRSFEMFGSAFLPIVRINRLIDRAANKRDNNALAVMRTMIVPIEATRM